MMMSLVLDDFNKNRDQKVVFPTRKNERWRFSKIQKWQDKEYLPYQDETCEATIICATPYQAVVKNGRVISQTLPDGITLTKMPNTLPYHKDNPFAAMVNIEDKKNVIHCSKKIDNCLHIVHLYGESSFISSALEIVVDEGVSIELLESFEGGKDAFILHNTNVTLHNNSELLHSHIQLFDLSAAAVTDYGAVLNKNSKTSHFILLKGAEINQQFITVKLLESSSVDLSALLQGNQKQKQILCTDLVHEQNHSKSRQIAKHVLKDKSTSVFDARSIVKNSAQYSQARQESYALLLDEGTTVHAKPHLEIYTDNLEASHGATVGQLDEDALYYLQSRGLNEEQAKTLLIDAFVNDLFDKIKNQETKELMLKHSGIQNAAS